MLCFYSNMHIPISQSGERPHVHGPAPAARQPLADPAHLAAQHRPEGEFWRPPGGAGRARDTALSAVLLPQGWLPKSIINQVLSQTQVDFANHLRQRLARSAAC